MADDFQLSGFVDLAVALRRPIVLFDLEATTLRGRPNFGITEVQCLTAISTERAAGVIQYGSLVNPEAPIDERAEELTGITQAMVAGAEPWNRRYMRHFAEWAPHAYFAGFNSNTFDLPAVQDQAKRYGGVIPEFPYKLDVRRLHLKLSGAKSQAGTLSEVAAQYGVRPKGKLHRATADVVLTAETLSVMVHAYGLDEVLEFLLAPPKEAARSKNSEVADSGLSTHQVAQYIKSSKARTAAEVALALSADASKVSFEMGKVIDEKLLEDPFVLEDSSQQAWLVPAVQALPSEVKASGKLKEIHSALQSALPKGKRVDYLQLRLALLRQNLRWSSLRRSAPA